MTLLRRLATVLLVVGAAAAAALALVVVADTGRAGLADRPAAGATSPVAGTAPAGAAAEVPDDRAADGRPRTSGAAATPPAPRGPTPHQPARPGAHLERELVPGPTLLGVGEEGDDVRDLQARLAQIAWFTATPTGVYGDVTAAAVSGFQAKREIPVTGAVDQRTMDRLLAMTREPTEAELTGAVADTAGTTPGTLDPRCREGRVLCVDKSTSTLRWVVDGEVLRTMDARFGGSGTPTREGLFQVQFKSRDHVSSLYETSMPFAMFFSGGQAVHYSPDFAATGYAGASHGCVNIRDYDGIAALYDEVQVGDAVVVYWS